MSYGRLITIAGPMFAGKSETIIDALINKEICGFPIKNPIVFKHELDESRYGSTHIVSHNKKQFPCKLLGNDTLSQLKVVMDCDWVFFDEAEFFEPKLFIEVCFFLLAHGINVCCAGLNQDSFGKPFGAMGEIMAMSDNIIMVCSVCKVCQKQASKTQRLSITESIETVCVGGAKEFEARCLEHWSSTPI